MWQIGKVTHRASTAGRGHTCYSRRVIRRPGLPPVLIWWGFFFFLLLRLRRALPTEERAIMRVKCSNDSCSPTDSLWWQFVRYHIPGINPKGTKSPFLLLKVNCKSWCHFSWLPQTVPSSAARPIICWPVIYLVTSFPSFLASFIHTPSFPSPPLHHSAYPISSPRSHLPISPPLPLSRQSGNGLVHHAGAP